MAKLGRLLASVGAVALFAVQLSCDQSVYHPDEIRVEKTFQSIAIGITEADLTKQLGEPIGRIIFDPARGTFQYFVSTDPTSIEEFRTFDAIKDSRHSELRFLPVGTRGNTILVFVKGTVHGYFYFGKAGRLEDKVVVVS